MLLDVPVNGQVRKVLLHPDRNGYLYELDRETGEVFRGDVPSYSVVVPGTVPGKPTRNGEAGPGLYCAVIVKRVDEKTRAKISINELLRD